MAIVLVTAHLGRHFRIFGHYDYKVLLDMGHEVHIAANFKYDLDQFEDGRVIKHQVDFDRNPLGISNFKAFRQLKNLFRSVHFDLVHCQSPSGGAITRLATRSIRKKGTKVLYTAHGLHFFKGAPLKNWILYYGIEKLLGRLTDCIITINKEDFEASKNKLKINKVEHINGVGINLDKYQPQSKERKEHLRKKYGYNQNNFIIVYVGELSYRKQQSLIINSAAILNDKIGDLKILLVGVGELESEYKKMVKELGLEGIVNFMGYRNDVPDLMMLSDIAVSASRQEGLPVNIMEAMATGLPLVVTNCRGNRDLVEDGINGYIVDIDDSISFSKAVIRLYNSKSLRESFKKENVQLIKKYSLDKIKKEMERIFSDILK